MTETPVVELPLRPSPEEQTYPTLTTAQVARVASYGRVRRVAEGEVLIEAGSRLAPFFVVVSAPIAITIIGAEGTLIKVHLQGEFAGEVTLLTGRRTLFRAWATKAGEVIELDRECFLSLIRTDSELGEIIMRAFILRRVALLSRGIGDAIVVGSRRSAGTLRIKEFLTRNGHPYEDIDLERDADVQELLGRFNLSAHDVPVVICRGTTVLRNPTNQQIADCLNFNETIDAARVRDLVVVGAGPAGLSAAVYAASEGLDVLVIETWLSGRHNAVWGKSLQAC